MLGLLEVDDGAAAPHDAARQEAHLLQKRRHLAAGLHVGGGQLQMIALFRVGDTAARQERAPQEGRAAAVVLQQGEVHMQHQRLAGIVAQRVQNAPQLLRLGDLENQLAAGQVVRRQPVELHIERPLEQPGQAGGKLRILGDDPHLLHGEGVAVQQRAVALGPCAAQPLHRAPAQLRLGLIGKRLHCRPPCYAGSLGLYSS